MNKHHHYNTLIVLSFLICYSVTPSCCQSRYGQTLDKTFFKVLNSKKGLFYAGIDNPLRIILPDSIRSNGIHVISSNGLLIKDKDHYNLIPDRPGKVRLSVCLISPKDTLPLGYKYFTVKNIPQPRLKINNRVLPENGPVYKSELLNCDSLSIYIDDDIAGSEEWYRIKDFSVGYYYGGFYISHLNKSNQFNNKVRQMINIISPGKEIIIRTTVESKGNIKKELPIYRLSIY